MSKPDWCPQEVWDEAETSAKEATRDAMRDPLMPYFVTVAPHIARAILAAEKRGEEREREACSLAANEAITNGTDLSTLDAAIIGSLAEAAIRARSVP